MPRFHKSALVLGAACALMLALCAGCGGSESSLDFDAEVRSSSTGKMNPAIPLTADEILEADGYDYPEDLVEIAELNAETLEYVRNYPKYRYETPEIDLTEEAQSDTVPLLIQYDYRWGYRKYGSESLIGWAGCAPTCLSMVAIYLTKNAEYTPLAVAEYAYENGYYTDGNGTTWTLISEGCTHFGISAHALSLTESKMKEILDQGYPIICSVGPGTFTTIGHFIVIRGYDENGFIVNDPFSRLRSAQRYTYATISPQVKGIWYFTLS